MSRGDMLFSQYDLSNILENRAAKMAKEIDNIDANRLLNTSVDDWCDYFESEYEIEVPQIKQDEINIDQNEANVDLRHNPNYHVSDRSRPTLARGTEVVVYIPFDGDAELFKCRPSAFNFAPPHAEVRSGELVLSFASIELTADAIKSALTRELGEIRQWLGRIEQNVRPFNEALRQTAKQRIEKRREKLLKDQGLVADLGFPIRRRNDAPTTYAAPEVQRKVRVAKPGAAAEPFKPEPTLPAEDYDHILTVVSNMVAVMERSPHAFRGMREEDLRQHFLVQLNGQYEGQATGETFNFEGKTDILIRSDGRNIFIAECMFWEGPKSLEKKLDQLLGYACWRDTKTAILVFNRTKNLSAVLAKIPDVVKAHPNYKREQGYKAETGFRFVLRHRDDPNRELVLTVLAFEVPT